MSDIAYDPTTGEIPMDIAWSAERDQLFAALAMAQGAIRVAAARGKSAFPGAKKYGELPQIVEACREALSKAEIAVVQIPTNQGESIALTTFLGHKSGQWVSGVLSVKPAKFDAQGAGSVITYLRRYALAAMVGVVAEEEDDDGEAAVGRGRQTSDKDAQFQAPDGGGKSRQGKTASPKVNGGGQHEPVEGMTERHSSIFRVMEATLKACQTPEAVDGILKEKAATMDALRAKYPTQTADLDSLAAKRKTDILGEMLAAG